MLTYLLKILFLESPDAALKMTRKRKSNYVYMRIKYRNIVDMIFANIQLYPMDEDSYIFTLILIFIHVHIHTFIPAIASSCNTSSPYLYVSLKLGKVEDIIHSIRSEQDVIGSAWTRLEQNIHQIW
jgi:predicted secreted protein